MAVKKKVPRPKKDEIMYHLVGGPYLASKEGLPYNQAKVIRDGLVNSAGIEIVAVS